MKLNAKEMKLPHGTLAEVARRLEISEQWCGECWKKERQDVVDMVAEVVKEWAIKKAEVAAKKDEISETLKEI